MNINTRNRGSGKSGAGTEDAHELTCPASLLSCVSGSRRIQQAAVLPSHRSDARHNRMYKCTTCSSGSAVVACLAFDTVSPARTREKTAPTTEARCPRMDNGCVSALGAEMRTSSQVGAEPPILIFRVTGRTTTRGQLGGPTM